MANEAKENFKRLFSRLRSDRKSLGNELADDGRSSYASHQNRVDRLRREIADREQDVGANRSSGKVSPLPGTETAIKKAADKVRPEVFGNVEHWKTAVKSHPVASKVFGNVEPIQHGQQLTFSKMDDDGFVHHLRIEPSKDDKFHVGVRASDSRHKYVPFEYGSTPEYGEDNDLNKAMDAAFHYHALRNKKLRAFPGSARTFDYTQE